MHLFELPIEIINQIFDFCTYGVLHNVSQTSKLMYKIYKKYDKPYIHIKNKHNKLDDVILYIENLQKSVNRECMLQNKKYKHPGICTDEILHSIMIYIAKYYQFSCYICKKINNLRYDYINGFYYDIYFCERCVIYVCEDCHDETIFTKCPGCKNNVLMHIEYGRH